MTFPRAHLTQKLRRLVQDIEDNPQRTVSRKDLRKFEVQRIWVFGSYARGAMQCGDLDLVMETKSLDSGCRLIETQCIRKVFRMQNLDLYEGTPSRAVGLPSRVAEEAILIWDHNDASAKENLDQIEVREDAGRFARPYDVFPFPWKHMPFSHETADQIVEALSSGVLKAAWVPFDNTAEPTELLWKMGYSLRGYTQKMRTTSAQPKGQKTATVWDIGTQVAGAVARLPKGHNHNGWTHTVGGKTVGFLYGGAYVAYGTHFPSLSILDDFTAHSIVWVPHSRKGQEPGAWVLSWGPNHPLILAFEGANSVWYDADCSVCEYTSDMFCYGCPTLYPSREDVCRAARELDIPEDETTPREISSLELLYLMVNYNRVDFTIMDFDNPPENYPNVFWSQDGGFTRFLEHEDLPYTEDHLEIAQALTP